MALFNCVEAYQILVSFSFCVFYLHISFFFIYVDAHLTIVSILHLLKIIHD